MKIVEFVGDRLGNPLDWPSARKASLLLRLHFFLQCIYVFALHFLVSSPSLSQHLNVDVTLVHLSFFKTLTLVSLGLNILVTLMQNHWKNDARLEHLAAQFFALTQVYYGYTIGLMSLPTGVVLAGVPIVGFIFFDRKAVLYSLATGLVAIVFFSWATFIDLLPYAPMAYNITTDRGQIDPVWAAIYAFFTIPHLILIFLISHYALLRWRRREAEIHFMSSTDSLTGILNRRSVLNHLLMEQKNSARHGTPLSVLMIDLDHFKSINDTWGHSTGDRVLKKAAETLARSVRQNDFVGRYGGEEFLIVLPGLEHEKAHQLAERIRMALSHLTFDVAVDAELSLTASMGLCCADPDMNLTSDQLIQEADKALYRAKNSGRNKLVVS